MTSTGSGATGSVGCRSHGAIAVLTLDRPRALNALNEQLLDEFDYRLDSIEASDAVQSVIVVGAGRAFCAGNDLKERGVDAMSRVRRMHALVLRLDNFSKPTVAAVNGLALGGGLELAMACTFRVALDGVQMGLPESKMNLMPGFGGTQLLPRLVGQSRALDMLLTGESVDSATALRIGLVDRVTDRAPVEAAIGLLSRYSTVRESTYRSIRSAVRDGSGLPLEDALGVERRLVERLSSGGAGSSAAQAFREGKRFK